MTPARPGPAARGRLAEGMTITARVRARVLGAKLLELDAFVDVAPAPRDVAPAPRPAPRRAPSQRSLARGAHGNGRIGSHLGEVAAALERGGLELAEARRMRP